MTTNDNNNYYFWLGLDGEEATEVTETEFFEKVEQERERQRKWLDVEIDVV